MNTTTLNLILAVIAIVGGFGSIIAWHKNLTETRRSRVEQRKATRELMEHTSNLEHRVQLLSTHLDQRIERLDRVRDLINNLMRGSVLLRLGSKTHDDKLQAFVTRLMAVPELRGLIKTIGDSQLEETYDKLDEIMADPIWKELWIDYSDPGLDPVKDKKMKRAGELIFCQTGHTTAMHQRIAELKEEITSAETMA